jgi:hypothetical protein
METSQQIIDDKLTRLVTFIYINNFEQARILEKNDPELAERIYDTLIEEYEIPSLDIVEYVLN